ncbi:MAG: metallophosphoesterase [Ruminococcus sp.]|jgi:predicted phosphohydrolase|nr:metallophosphoesterase [Ruminococcus sp.]
MANLYAIADTHLTFDPAKNMEQYKGWENWMERLRENWCNTVKPDDTAVIAGDIAWAIRIEDEIPVFEFLNSLPGTKILLKGNHDLWWENIGRMNRIFSEFPSFSLNFLKNNHFVFDNYTICGCTGVDITLNCQSEKINSRNLTRLENSLRSADKELEPIVFFHFPPLIYIDGKLEICNEIMQIFKKFGVKRCFYGHIHGEDMKFAYDGTYDGVEFKLVAADFVQFMPVLVV